MVKKSGNEQSVLISKAEKTPTKEFITFNCEKNNDEYVSNVSNNNLQVVFIDFANFRDTLINLDLIQNYNITLLIKYLLSTDFVPIEGVDTVSECFLYDVVNKKNKTANVKFYNELKRNGVNNIILKESSTVRDVIYGNYEVDFTLDVMEMSSYAKSVIIISNNNNYINLVRKIDSLTNVFIANFGETELSKWAVLIDLYDLLD